MKGIAIITGASTGIGEASARRFLEDGWAVIGVARRLCPVPGVRSLIADLGDPGFADGLRQEMDAVLDELACQGLARVCLIHNAGRMNGDSSLAVDAAEIRMTLQVNVVAPMVINALVAPRLGPGSSILYLGSTLSEKAIPGAASYVVSKHAVAGLMRATCQDLVGRQVHCACICPGFVDTPMLRARVGEDVAAMAAFAAMTTYCRVVQPGETAELLLQAALMPSLNGALIHANYGQIER